MGAARRLILASALAAAALAGGGAVAQDLGRVVSPILTLDRDGLFAGTLYGQRVNRELAAATAAMAEETRNIEAALEQEELALTEKRATMEAEAFRALAVAFDEKVQALREDRTEAEAALRDQITAAQTDFFARIGPVLGQLVRERGAVLIVDARAILLAAADVDITVAAIERIDAELGDGSTLDDAPAAPTDGAAPVEGGDGIDIIPAPEDAPAAPGPEADTGTD
ncbi:MAG: OmpH family outer membrane protein [Maritimibacter sp.]|nr:OmpH family outer membrane protein [Maritimibacter sp.]